MAVLTVQVISRAGITPSYAAATETGDEFANDGYTFLLVKNGAGAPITVTVVSPATVQGLAIADVAVSVTNGQERMIGPFPPSIFNAGDGRVDVTYSSHTSVTIGAFRCQP